jgi:hypothetical protein
LQADNGIFKALHLAIVEHDDTEPIRRVVNIARRTNCIKDEIVVLSAARDKDIDARDVVAYESQLRSIPFLQDEY